VRTFSSLAFSCVSSFPALSDWRFSDLAVNYGSQYAYKSCSCS
jgi:hypothetical protein